MSELGPLPDYKNPPIHEVVCGALFIPLADFLTAHVGRFAQSVETEFPGVEEQPPIWPKVERFEGEPALDLNLPIGPSGFPMPRTWLVSEDGARLLQVQRDRFLFNWRRRPGGEKYPRFKSIYTSFNKNLYRFAEFVEQAGLGDLALRQFELTYINRIPQGEVWEDHGGIASIFPDFRWRQDVDRFLNAPVGLQWQMTFDMPNRMGRLHMTVNRVVRESDKVHMIQFDLTARGMNSAETGPEPSDWFEVAHEWIVRAFADLTSQDVQQESWGRKST